MNIFPDRETFLQLARQGNVIPVYTDLMADFETPVSAYAKLKDAGPSYLLESVEGGETLSRYSFIGCRPRKTLACGPITTEIRVPGQPPLTVPTPADPLTARHTARPASIHRGCGWLHRLRICDAD